MLIAVRFIAQNVTLTGAPVVVPEVDILPPKIDRGEVMPLSKARDKERKRLAKELTRLELSVFQPKYIIHEGKRVVVPDLDADGNVIWEEL